MQPSTSLLRDLVRKRDFYAGGLMMLLGLGVALKGSSYRAGTLMHMGPGFMPTALGIILVLLGIAIAAAALATAPATSFGSVTARIVGAGAIAAVGGAGAAAIGAGRAGSLQFWTSGSDGGLGSEAARIVPTVPIAKAGSNHKPSFMSCLAPNFTIQTKVTPELTPLRGFSRNARTSPNIPRLTGGTTRGHSCVGAESVTPRIPGPGSRPRRG